MHSVDVEDVLPNRHRVLLVIAALPIRDHIRITG
jgi:hypothetical protein